jgi:hypothetical protein
MKKIILFVLLCATSAFSQLPEIVRDNFNLYSVGQDINGQLKWRKLKSSGTDTVGTFVTDNTGRIISSTTAGAGHMAGMLWDSTYVNDGVNPLFFGVTVPVKSGPTPGYFDPGYQDMYFFMMMDSAGGATNGVINGWSGSALVIGAWDNNRQSYQFANVTNGAIGTPYGGGTNVETYPSPLGHTDDTLWVKVLGNTITLYKTFVGVGSGVFFTQTMTQTVKGTGKFGLMMRQTASITTRLSDFFIGSGTPPPPVTPSTRDTTAPIILTAQASQGAIDTSNTFYWTIRAIDSDTIGQKNPGLNYESIRIDSLGGPFKDSAFVGSLTDRDHTLNTTARKYAQGNYLVTFTAVDDSGNVRRTTIVTQVGVARTLWCSAYYDVWQMNPLGSTWWSEPPDRLHITSGITHIIQFPNGNIITTYPYFAPVGGGSVNDSMDVAYGTGRPTTPTPYRDSLVAIAHRNNVRVLLCVNAVCATNLTAVLDANADGIVNGIDSAKCDTLTRSIALYLSRHGYDGVDINIENGCGITPSVSHTALLIRRMRAQLNLVNAGIGGRMTMTLSPTSGAEGSYIPSVCNANVDQINPQTYDNQYAFSGCVGVNAGWYSGNVYKPSNAQLGADSSCFGAGNLAHSINDHGPGRWFNAGFNKSILGVGVSTYGRLRMYNRTNRSDGSVRPPVFSAITSDGYFHNTPAQVNAVIGNGGALQPYDTVTKSQQVYGQALSNVSYEGTAAGLTAGQFYELTYPTARVAQDQVQWVKDNGYSGIMLFDYQMDADPGNADVSLRNPIISAAALATGGFLQPLPPSTPTNSVPVNGATSQSLLGLLFSWSSPSGATSYHFQISTSSSFSTILTEFDVTNNQAITGQNPFNTPLASGTTYYWHVNATGVSGTSSYSSTSQFTTVVITTNPPSTPVQQSPVDGATVTSTTVQLVITSGSVSDTISAYKYQVKASDSTGAFMVNDSSSNSVTYTLNSLSPGTRYFWRVAAKNGSGTSNFTPYRNFIVQVSVAVAPLTQSAFTFNPQIGSMVLADQLQGRVEQDVPINQWSSQGLRAGQVKVYARGFRDSAGNNVPYGSDILNQPSTVSQPWTFNAGLTSSSITTPSLALSGFFQTDLIPAVSFANHGSKNLGTIANPWLVTFTNGLMLVNPSFTNPNIGLNFLIPDFTSSKNLYFRPYGSLTTDTVATVGNLNTLFHSIRASGYAQLTDSAVIAGTGGATVTQSGRTITISATAGTVTGKAIQDSLNARSDTIATNWYFTDTDGNHPWRLMYNNAGTLSEQLRIYANNGTANIQGRAGGGITIGDNNSGNFLTVGATPGFTMVGTSSFRFKFGRNYAIERDTNYVWSDSSANNRTNFAVGSRGTISMRDTTAVGIGVFTTTATVCTLTVQQASVNDNYLLTPIGTTVGSNDVLSAESTATGVIVHRPASGTSGLSFFYMRIRRK